MECAEIRYAIACTASQLEHIFDIYFCVFFCISQSVLYVRLQCGLAWVNGGSRFMVTFVSVVAVCMHTYSNVPFSLIWKAVRHSRSHGVCSWLATAEGLRCVAFRTLTWWILVHEVQSWLDRDAPSQPTSRGPPAADSHVVAAEPRMHFVEEQRQRQQRRPAASLSSRALRCCDNPSCWSRCCCCCCCCCTWERNHSEQIDV